MKNLFCGFFGASMMFVIPRLVQAQIKFKPPNFLNFNTIEELVVGILNILIIIAIPIIVLRTIYAGFLYVSAQGNPGKITEATGVLTGAIIGGVLVIGAVALSEIVQNLVGAFAAQ